MGLGARALGALPLDQLDRAAASCRYKLHGLLGLYGVHRLYGLLLTFYLYDFNPARVWALSPPLVGPSLGLPLSLMSFLCCDSSYFRGFVNKLPFYITCK